MKEYRRIALLLVLASSVLERPAAFAETPANIVTKGHITKGRALLTDKCARCHSIERQGASPLPAAPAFRDLHKKYPIATIAEALAEGIVTGHPDMPSTPFVQDDIDAIIGYIESLTP